MRKCMWARVSKKNNLRVCVCVCLCACVEANLSDRKWWKVGCRSHKWISVQLSHEDIFSVALSLIFLLFTVKILLGLSRVVLRWQAYWDTVDSEVLGKPTRNWEEGSCEDITLERVRKHALNASISQMIWDSRSLRITEQFGCKCSFATISKLRLDADGSKQTWRKADSELCEHWLASAYSHVYTHTSTE